MDETNAQGSDVVDDYPYQVAGHSHGKANRMFSFTDCRKFACFSII